MGLGGSEQMRKFFRNTKGAVTVFVTLLLIPAILVTGTGVDLARVYAARSTTHDANQLAANSILTTYDTLLQDLYGLYAVAEKDDNLTAMVDVYVRASLFGEEITDAQLSEFRLFGGQESVSSSVSPSAPLSNVEILRRQIEEYSKWRVPVAIVSDIIDRLNNDEEFKELAANTEASQKKIAVDEQLEIVLEKFKAVKEKADEIVKEYNEWDEKEAFKHIGEYVEQIRFQFRQMLIVREAYESETDVEKLDDLLAQYEAISKNITSCINGGWIGTGWVAAHVDNNGNDVPGEWGNPTYKNMSAGYKEVIDFEVGKLKAYESEFETLVALCREADTAKNELQTRIDALEGKLDDGTCNSELVKNMKEELNEYKELLKYNFTELGQTMKTEGMRYINSVVAPLENIQGYGKTTGADQIILSFNSLKNVWQENGFQIDLNVNTALYQNTSDRLKAIANSAVDVYTAHQRLPSFRGLSDTHEACYKLLENLDSIGVTDERRSQDEEGEKGKVTDIFKTVKTLWAGLTDYDGSPGANSYSKPAGYSGSFTTQGQGMELDFGLTDFNFGGDSEDGIKGTLNTLTSLVSGKIGVMDMIGNVLNNASNRVLLVGYATNMFSNQTTNLQLDDDGNVKELLSLTGQPIDADHNYFYTSEWEYLFNGSLKTSDNLAKVTVTLLAIRFLANYASSYIITSVNAEIRSYEAAVSAIPFAGAALRFLVRPLVVLVESALDVSWLRGGEEVLLMKTTADDWTFSISGTVASTLKGIAENMTESNSDGLKLYYSDYLMVFLLASEPDVIAARTGDLIALNITTHKNSTVQNARGDARAGAIASVSLFDLSKAYTTFAVSTTTEVRFMFLSMPFAQTGLNGIVPSTTFPVVATDYRGY